MIFFIIEPLASIFRIFTFISLKLTFMLRNFLYFGAFRREVWFFFVILLSLSDCATIEKHQKAADFRSLVLTNRPFQCMIMPECPVKRFYIKQNRAVEFLGFFKSRYLGLYQKKISSEAFSAIQSMMRGIMKEECKIKEKMEGIYPHLFLLE